MCADTQIGIKRKIRCILVHDHVLLRQGMRRLLEDEPDIVVVAEAGSAREALRKISEDGPEVVIADARLFECAAEQAERTILRASAGSKVLFLTARSGEGPVGGSSYAMGQTSAEQLVEMVRKVASPRVESRREAARWPVEEFLPRNRALTAREREVLKLLAEGRTVRSVASVLGVSNKTVDAHKFNLMRKLGIHNKAELVMWAIQQRVVKLPVNF